MGDIMQDKKKKGTNMDNIANLKNLMSLNDSILEVAKGAIKNKNNDIVFKMMDTLGERPELWFSYLSIAIIYQNFTITKYLVEKFDLDVSNTTEINAGSVSSDILVDKPANDVKENYVMVECPWIIQAAIGGDIDIFNYILDHGAKVGATGHIGLSKKNRNSVVSNIL